METWTLAGKLVVVAYVGSSYVLGGGSAPLPTILASLAAICLAALRLLTPPRALRVTTGLLTLGVSIGASLLVDPGFLLLLPLAGAELLHDLGAAALTVPLPAVIGLFFVPPGYLPGYILAAGLGLAVFYLAHRADVRERSLREHIDRLRQANEIAVERSARSADHEESLGRMARLEERNRLATAVHDRLGHAISGTTLQLEAALAVLETDPRTSRAMVQAGVTALREGMDGIRTVLRDLKPAREELGIERVRSLADRFTVSSGVRAEVSHLGDLTALGAPQWQVILDNLRECLTNTLRHGQAGVVRIHIAVLRRIVTARARDDGRGAVVVRPGLGISGMEERTERLGGTLVVDGAHGFSVTTVLPLEGAALGEDAGTHRG